MSFRYKAAKANECRNRLHNLLFQLEDLQRMEIEPHYQALIGLMVVLGKEICDEIDRRELMK